MVIKNGEVVYAHRETTTFDNGSAKELLDAVKGCSAAATPTTEEAM